MERDFENRPAHSRFPCLCSDLFQTGYGFAFFNETGLRCRGLLRLLIKFLEAVIFLPAIYVGLVMPLLSKHAFGNRAEFIKIFRKAFNVLSIFALPLAAYIFVLSDKIIRIIGGSGFAQAGPVLKILSIAILMIFFGNLGGNAIVALNLQKKGMWIYFAGAVFNVVANLILIPRYTYFATAWTTVATEIIITFWMFWLIKKETGASADKGIFLKAVFATAVMVVVNVPVSSIDLFWPPSSPFLTSRSFFS